MRYVVRALIVIASLVLLPSVTLAQSSHAPALTPMPCPVQAWEYSEPGLQPLPGAKAFAGRYDGGVYNIEIPDKWNGELVLYAHGQVDNLSPKGSVVRVQVPRLRQHWIDAGFAWAASSYRCNGSVYGIGLLDTMALRERFTSLNQGQAPARVYLVGHSLGGRITILGLRQFPETFSGGLAMCAAGQETTDQRVAFRAAAELITGVQIAEASVAADLARMEAVLGKPPDYTAKGKQLASVQIEMTGGPRAFALEGLARRFLENVRVGVVTSPSELIKASSNVGTHYAIASGFGLTADELNSRARRIPGVGADQYVELSPFDGKITRPLLTIHGTGDLQVPISQQQALKRGAISAGTEHLLVQRIMRIPGHCAFSPQEESRAFDDLVTWVRDGVRPEGDEVLGDLRNAGLKFTDPIRPGDPGSVSVAP